MKGGGVRKRQGRGRKVLGQVARTLRLSAVIVVAVAAIRMSLIEAYRIPTSSMENTLLVGDFLLVNKAVFGTELPFTNIRLPAFREPQRGEVIVFHPPHDPERTYVKRVVGAPGDVLQMEGFGVWVNGMAIDEPYARYGGFGDERYTGARVRGGFVDDLEAAVARPLPPDEWGPVVVPDGKYFVLGDNRDNSEDSRFWGFVDREEIQGRPLFVYYSAHPLVDPEPEPVRWWQRVRWDRIGAPIQ
jgi:signal peptidase I